MGPRRGGWAASDTADAVARRRCECSSAQPRAHALPPGTSALLSSARCSARFGIRRRRFIKPHCPWQNGKVERFNRTLATEWAYRQPYRSNDERTAGFTTWLEHYNTERHHHAVGAAPTTRLSPT